MQVLLVMELHIHLHILAVVLLAVLGQEGAFEEAFLRRLAEVLQAGPSAEELHLVEGFRLVVELRLDVDLKSVFMQRECSV